MIITGDCLEVMKTLETGSIDAIVTDPPYGLSFMGKNWDHSVPGMAFWREALRVAKPGCHILAAGGSRTYHRLAVAIEDAGWEIRDCVMWLYGSGFPKSHDVSKAIDRKAGAVREVVGISSVTGARQSRTMDDGNKGTRRTFQNDEPVVNNITTPTTEAAKQWQGWGTALKPAFEPFILARKPLEGTVAANVQRHGCGGLNVDVCRVGTDELTPRNNKPGQNGWKNSSGGYIEPSPLGRWPANVIHDGSDEVTRPFGTAARFFYCAKASRSEREAGLDGMEEQKAGSLKLRTDSHSERNGLTTASARNHHPTVKPVALMSYLCKIITPPNGTILDPFCGSGSTGVAAIREGFNFIGIESNPDYAGIATRRIEHERSCTPLLEAIK